MHRARGNHCTNSLWEILGTRTQNEVANGSCLEDATPAGRSNKRSHTSVLGPVREGLAETAAVQAGVSILRLCAASGHKRIPGSRRARLWITTS